MTLWMRKCRRVHIVKLGVCVAMRSSPLFWAFLISCGGLFLLLCVSLLLPKSLVIYRSVWSDKPGSASETASSSPPKVLLISYDGLRWDYLSHATVPNMRYLMQRGVHASFGLKNTFITITAPNHYGIVTGLYEESHGIVANNFYDPILNETFRYFATGNRTDPRFFNKGVPIWVLNDAMGKDRQTGCVMWVGCDVSIQGTPLPLHHISWNNTMTLNPSWQNRVDYLVSWFKDPNAPINLGLLYIEEPDETGHAYGPHGAPTLEKVKEVDQLTGYLLWCLQREGILDEVNIIMTADHGMADVPNVGGVINLGDYLKDEWFTYFGGGPNFNVLPKDGHKQDILDALKGVQHINVYTNDTVPEDYHYRDNPRVLPIQIEAHIHYVLSHTKGKASDNSVDDGHGRKIDLTANNGGMFGAHGYNNSLPEMHPFFIASGPAFKKGFAVDTFENIDLFPLMAKILGIEKIPPNNGSLERVKSLLAASACEEKVDINDGNHLRFHSVSLASDGSWILLLIFMVLAVWGLIAVVGTRFTRDPVGRGKLDQKPLECEKGDSQILPSEAKLGQLA